MRVHQQPAYVLHARAWSESSLLLDILSRAHGRLMLIAKGARRQKARSRGILMPFRPLLVSWSGKGQLPLLTAAEQTEYVAELDGESLACAYYVNELILKLLHRFDAHEKLFDAYAETLSGLRDSENRLVALRVFEKRLLSEIGFGLVLDRDVETGEAINPEARYAYAAQSGPTKVNAAQQNQPTIGGDTLQALRAESFPSERCLNEARKITAGAINRQLQQKTLRTRKVMYALRRWRA